MSESNGDKDKEDKTTSEDPKSETREGEGEGEGETKAPTVKAPKRSEAKVPTVKVPGLDLASTKPAAPGVGSLFDSGWDKVIGGEEASVKPTGPDAGDETKPSVPTFSAPEPKARTSGQSTSLSGQFERETEEEEGAPEEKSGASEEKSGASEEKSGASEEKKDASEEKKDAPEPEAKKEKKDASKEEEGASEPEEKEDTSEEKKDAPQDEDTSKKEQVEDVHDTEEDEADEEAAEDDKGDSGDEGPPEVARRTEPEEEPRSNTLLIVLAIAAVLVVVVLWTNKSGDEPKQDRQGQRDGPAKPNARTRDAPERRPEPRPPDTARTHAGDPKLAALQERETEGETGEDEAGETEGETGETGASETGETGEGEPSELEPLPTAKEVDDPRDPSLVPPGTPEENLKAFTRLPVAPSDGPPLGGVGKTGIHIDDVAMASGKENSDCDDPTRRFSVEADTHVNVCFRAVHSREEENVRVIWEKDGKVTRRGKVRVPTAHAYKTRAYLIIRPEYVGSWRVRIVPEGEEDIDLIVAEFEITE